MSLSSKHITSKFTGAVFIKQQNNQAKKFDQWEGKSFCKSAIQRKFSNEERGIYLYCMYYMNNKFCSRLILQMQSIIITSYLRRIKLKPVKFAGARFANPNCFSTFKESENTSGKWNPKIKLCLMVLKNISRNPSPSGRWGYG